MCGLLVERVGGCDAVCVPVAVEGFRAFPGETGSCGNRAVFVSGVDVCVGGRCWKVWWRKR
jgi:hypothetical protein